MARREPIFRAFRLANHCKFREQSILAQICLVEIPAYLPSYGCCNCIYPIYRWHDCGYIQLAIKSCGRIFGQKSTVGEMSATGGGADPMAFTHDWHQAVIEDFAEAIAGGTRPMATGRSALLTHAVIDAMQIANRTGQKTRVIS